MDFGLGEWAVSTAGRWRTVTVTKWAVPLWVGAWRVGPAGGRQSAARTLSASRAGQIRFPPSRYTQWAWRQRNLV